MQKGFSHTLLSIFCFFPIILIGQITFFIDQLPLNTPVRDSIYLASSSNKWRADHPNYRFQKNADGNFELTIPQNNDNFEYKITRGDWKKVEANAGGWPIMNRKYSQNNGQEVHISVSAWEDLIDQKSLDSIYFTIASIPESTPKDASIYVVGNFNEWDPGHPRCEMKKNADNTFSIAIDVREDTLQYKFTRGSWETVEGKKSGRARANRTYIIKKGQSNIIKSEIKSWEDLNANPINPYTFVLLLAAFQGLLLILAINTLQNNNVSANRILSLLIFIISIALIARVSTYYRDIFTEMPKLHIIADYIFFLYAPLFLLYIQKLLRPHKELTYTWWLQLVPFLGHFLVYLPFWLMNNYDFRLGIVDYTFQNTFIITGGVALLFNTFYWFWCKSIINKYQKDAQNFQAHTPNTQFLNAVMSLKIIGILLWLMTYAFGAYAKWTDENLNHITDISTDAAWAIFAMTVYILGYYAMRQPELFKLPESEELHEPKPSTDQEEREKYKEWIEKVEFLMNAEQAFLNPKLTLPDLAEQLQTNVHTLSKVINEGFGKNFNDFVNSYRVEEFKRRVLIEPYKNQTFLAIALSVGFNSKTAFNRSFKKLTLTTPREYLKQQGPAEE
ncbi:MAG: helix-turn-helix domain-containing protein [Saprospiraceae bacterium]|nr:helix-turn-helix domain-containing protein [Saprospiraceae bacterium]